MEMSKSQYASFMKNLKKLYPQYAEQVESSLIIDEAGYKLGFFREPMVTFHLRMDDRDFAELSEKMEQLQRDSFSEGLFDDEKYSEYDEYIDFYNTVQMLRSEES